MSLLLLLFILLDIWFVEHKGTFVRNIFAVLSGRKSWVGVRPEVMPQDSPLSPGVLHPADAYPCSHFSEEMLSRLEELYIRDYSVRTDMTIIAKGFAKLGGDAS